MYALGGILQELLVGVTLFPELRQDKSSIVDALEAIRQRHPKPLLHWLNHDGPTGPSLADRSTLRSATPKTLRRSVGNELEAVVSKATSKDPEQRYSTASELRDDIKRYLQGEPVLAANPTSRDIWIKFAKRHRTSVSLAVLLICSLIAGFALSTYFWYLAVDRLNIAKAETERATANAKRAAESTALAQNATEQANAAAYAATIQAASAAAMSGDVGRLKGLLNQTSPERRGWEWDYLQSKADESKEVLYTSKGRITCLTVDSPRQRIAITTDNGMVEEMCLSPQAKWTTHPKHLREVRQVQYSKGGSLLVSAGMDGYVRLSALEDGRELWSTKVSDSTLDCVAFFDSDAKILAAGWDGVGYIIDTSTGVEIARLSGHTSNIRAIDVSVDESTLLTASYDSTVRLWRASSLECLRVLKGMRSEAHVASFSPGGDLVAAGGVAGDVCLWEVPTGNIKACDWLHREIVTELRFNEQGTKLATTSRDGTLCLQGTGNNEQPLLVNCQMGAVSAVAWSQDGTTVFTGGIGGAISAWNSSNGSFVRRFNAHTQRVEKLNTFQSGSQLVSLAEDRSVRLWNLQLDQPRERFVGHQDQLKDARLSPDNSKLITSSLDDTAKVWNLATGKEDMSLSGHLWDVSAASFSHDGSRIATASADGSACLWDAHFGRLIARLIGHNDALRSVEFNCDCSMLATCSRDATVRLWDGVTGKHRATLFGHTNTVDQVFFLPDGNRVVSASRDGTVGVWDAQSGSRIVELRGDGTGIADLSINKEGTLIGAGCESGIVCIWDAETFQEKVRLTGHTAAVNGVRFFSDGRRVATGSFDRSIRIWDIGTGVSEGVMRGHTRDVFCIGISPDDRRLVSSSRDGTVRLWDTKSSTELIDACKRLDTGVCCIV